MVRPLRLTFIASAVAACVWVSASADTPPTSRDAAVLRQKVAAILAFAEQPVSTKQAASSKQPRLTTVTEREVNAYFAFDGKNDIPAGVVEPAVTILGTGRLSGRAVVDLDAVRKLQNPTSLLDPASYLTGQLPVTAVGVLTTRNGVGQFQLESATVSGVPIPKLLLQQIVSYYSRTPQTPAGINIDDPFALPARIREIQVQRGQAIIVQ
jgi:hypothetical protein